MLIYNLLFIIQVIKQKMRAKLVQLTNNFSLSRLVCKTGSIKSISSSTDSSNKSIESCDEQHKAQAIKWILNNFNQKVKKDTLYLAIVYLNKLSIKSVYLTQDNWEKMAITILLLASKMNQIYPPKITTMISKCKSFITKEEIIVMQASVLQIFDFDIAIKNTAYTYMVNVLGTVYKNSLNECQKLLKMVAHHGEIYQAGDEILSYALIYLILPQYIRDMKLRQNNKIKLLAIKIYNIYIQTKGKERSSLQKQNQ